MLLAHLQVHPEVVLGKKKDLSFRINIQKYKKYLKNLKIIKNVKMMIKNQNKIIILYLIIIIKIKK